MTIQDFRSKIAQKHETAALWKALDKLGRDPKALTVSQEETNGDWDIWS